MINACRFVFVCFLSAIIMLDYAFRLGLYNNNENSGQSWFYHLTFPLQRHTDINKAKEAQTPPDCLSDLSRNSTCTIIKENKSIPSMGKDKITMLSKVILVGIVIFGSQFPLALISCQFCLLRPAWCATIWAKLAWFCIKHDGRDSVDRATGMFMVPL